MGIKEKENTMFVKYQKENYNFVKKIYKAEYKEMFDKLNTLFK